MALATYLDTLSSGMKARIDPVSRLPKQTQPAYVSSLCAKTDLSEANNALWSIARHKFPSVQGQNNRISRSHF